MCEGWSEAGWEPEAIPFTGNPGYHGELTEDDDAVAYFEELLSDDLIEFLVLETNRYAAQTISEVCIISVYSTIVWNNSVHSSVNNSDVSIVCIV